MTVTSSDNDTMYEHRRRSWCCRQGCDQGRIVGGGGIAVTATTANDLIVVFRSVHLDLPHRNIGISASRLPTPVGRVTDMPLILKWYCTTGTGSTVIVPLFCPTVRLTV